jgi:hypothetical protein
MQIQSQFPNYQQLSYKSVYQQHTILQIPQLWPFLGLSRHDLSFGSILSSVTHSVANRLKTGNYGICCNCNII